MSVILNYADIIMKKKGPALELTVSVCEEYSYVIMQHICLDVQKYFWMQMIPAREDRCLCLTDSPCYHTAGEVNPALLHQPWRINNNCCVSEY